MRVTATAKGRTINNKMISKNEVHKLTKCRGANESKEVVRNITGTIMKNKLENSKVGNTSGGTTLLEV